MAAVEENRRTDKQTGVLLAGKGEQQLLLDLIDFCKRTNIGPTYNKPAQELYRRITAIYLFSYFIRAIFCAGRLSSFLSVYACAPWILIPND